MNALPNPVFIAELGPCLVINKPGGLLTQGPPGIDSLELRIKTFIKQRDEKPGKVYLGVPHRLDRPASGVMLFARHIRAARRLAAQFQDRSVEKKYWAVVEGIVSEDSGQWTDHMRKLPDEAKSVISNPTDEGSQLARLRYRVIDRDDRNTWLEIALETGANAPNQIADRSSRAPNRRRRALRQSTQIRPGNSRPTQAMDCIARENDLL